MDSSTEREDLEALIGSAGWARVCEAAAKEYDSRLEKGVESALGDVSDVAALAKLRQIQASKNTVRWFLSWPRERLSAMSRSVDAKAETGSRRGRL